MIIRGLRIPKQAYFCWAQAYKSILSWICDGGMNKKRTFKKNTESLPFPPNIAFFVPFFPPFRCICVSKYCIQKLFAYHKKGFPFYRKPFLHYLDFPNKLLTLSQKLPPSSSSSVEVVEPELLELDWFCCCSSLVMTLLPPDSLSEEFELLFCTSSSSGSLVTVEEVRCKIQLDGI